MRVITMNTNQEKQLNNSWVVYEIPGHKVGVCQADRFPIRPNCQVNELYGRPKRSPIKPDDVKVLQRLEEITKWEAFEVETEWQDKLGYLSDIDKSWIALQRPESKAKMSVAKKGKPLSDEHKAKMSAAKEGVKRKPLSDEAKANISAGKKGKPLSDEHKASISAANKGKTLPDEVKAKMSDAKKGKSLSEETKAKISATQIARWKSHEQIQNHVQ